MSKHMEFYIQDDAASIQIGKNVYRRVSIPIDDFNAACDHYGFVKERTCRNVGCAAHGVRVAREEGGEVMNGHCCPACGSSGIVMTDDFEHDLTILKCRVCGEMFAISNMDAYNNGESWVFSEWANSIETQKRLCGKAVSE